MPRVINDLPSELLADIFFLRIYEERSRVYYDAYHPTPKWKDWYNFLSVCRHWNCIAMGTPLLWNFVDMGSSFCCIETMLKRSSDASLRVQPTGRNPHALSYNSQALRLILEQSHRIEHLIIFIKDVVADILLSYSHLLGPLSRIRFLRVHNETTSHPNLPFLFTPSCFLRTLNISGFTLQQIKPVLVPTIRNMTLFLAETGEDIIDSDEIDADQDSGSESEETGSGTDTSSAEEESSDDGENDEGTHTVQRVMRRVYTLHEFLVCISNIPSLEVVILENLLRVKPSLRSYPSLHLPCLKKLSLRLSMPDVDFLEALACPQGLCLHLSFLCTRLDATILKRIVAACWRCSQSSNSKERPMTLNLDSFSSWNFTVKFWPHVVSPKQVVDDSYQIDDIQLNFGTKEVVDFAAVYNWIFLQDIFSSIDTLSLSFGREPWSNTPIPALAEPLFNLNNLRVLLFSGLPHSHICELLSQTSSSSPPEPIFPTLKEVIIPHITHTNFRLVTSPGRDPPAWWFSEPNFTPFPPTVFRTFSASILDPQ